MSQYTVGTVDVVNSDATVVGNGTLFLTEVAVGDIFVRLGDVAFYLVASITNDTSLELAAAYGGVTGTAQGYSISRDFTNPDSIPYMNTKDIATAQIFTRAMLKIQDLLTGIVAGVIELTDLPITVIGDASAGYIPYDGLLPSRGIQINAVSIYAAIAPTGANMIWRVTKNTTEEAQDIILTDGSNHEKTFLTPFSFLTSDKLGLKCTQAGSTEPGGEIIITLHFQ